ncbi:MAG: hypothetical protein RI932_2537, partial [Pseudomonadota bacterium]
MAEITGLRNERVVLAVTGASGSIYAELLLRRLLQAKVRTYLVATDTARKVIATELGEQSLLAAALKSGLQMRLESNDLFLETARKFELDVAEIQELRVFSNDDFYAPIASGSEGATHMVVAP